ncbi:MAG: DUF1549 and DUF1553 domain-containing protein [Pirellulaceae bacterium]|nr:DUF1549 and DUF1553 domain-containing protein [Pirellulaceae bacterium]
MIRTALGWVVALVAILPGGREGMGQPLRPGRAKDYGLPPVALINQQIRQGWVEQGLRPSDLAPDGEWCRRLFIDVLGRIPTVEELRRFTASRDGDKRRKLVDELLGAGSYQEEFARHWAAVWTNVLIGRTGGSEPNSLTDRAGLEQYLRDALANHLPYDRLVYDLVTAQGTTRPGTDGFHGAVNFLVMKVNDDKGAQAAAATSRVFLGLQVQCAQCHNHPFNEWKQRKFWEFNAFFRQTRAVRREDGGDGPGFAELIDEDFSGEGSTPQEAEIYYELRNGQLEVAYPVFVDGTAISRSGRLQDVRRREQLGRLIVNSPLLERTLVNRLWAHFLGHGFTRPVDDMGPHNAPCHPQLLDDLAAAFRQNSCNLRDLMRWITLSQPYALSSRSNSTNATRDDPTRGETPKFSRFYLRQLDAEVLYESLFVARTQRPPASSPEHAEARQRWLRQFAVAFGNDEGGEATTFNGTIPQSLTMFNGELVRDALAIQPGTILHTAVHNDWKPLDRIHYVFEAGLARPATRDEINLAGQLLAAREGDASEAFQDLWWAVLNSNEFILNH